MRKEWTPNEGSMHRHMWCLENAICSPQCTTVKLEPIRVEIERRHVTQMTLVLGSKIQATRRARHDREIRRRWGDISRGRHRVVRSVTETTTNVLATAMVKVFLYQRI